MPNDDLPRVTRQGTPGGTFYWVIRYRDGSVFASIGTTNREQTEAIAKALAEAKFAGREQKRSDQ